MPKQRKTREYVITEHGGVHLESLNYFNVRSFLRGELTRANNRTWYCAVLGGSSDVHAILEEAIRMNLSGDGDRHIKCEAAFAGEKAELVRLEILEASGTKNVFHFTAVPRHFPPGPNWPPEKRDQGKPSELGPFSKQQPMARRTLSEEARRTFESWPDWKKEAAAQAEGRDVLEVEREALERELPIREPSQNPTFQADIARKPRARGSDRSLGATDRDIEERLRRGVRSDLVKAEGEIRALRMRVETLEKAVWGLVGGDSSEKEGD